MRGAALALVLAGYLILSAGQLQEGGNGDGQPRPPRPPAPANGTGGCSGDVGGGGCGQGGQHGNGTGPPPRNGTGQGDNNNDGRGGQGGQGQGGQPPRGDDPRQRNWGVPNAKNETEFDDRKSPRKIAFLGKSANMRIYPNYSDTSVYLQLRFGKIAELDAGGQRVTRHSVDSLANADSIGYSAGNLTYNGVNMSYVNISLNPMTRDEFSPACWPASGGGGDDGSASPRPPRPPAPASPYVPSIAVSLLFGLDDTVVLPYGSSNVTVPRNGLKWSVAYQNWPFCNDSNTLTMTLDLLLSGNSTAQISQSASGAVQTLVLALGSSYNASFTFYDYAMDSSSGSIRMPASTNITQNGSVVSVTMVLPNPKTYNTRSVFYDPLQDTVSSYLSSTDPGNGYVNTTLNATLNAGHNDNAAGSQRVTLWAAVAALLLSGFLWG